MILNEFFNLPQVFEKDMEEGNGRDSTNTARDQFISSMAPRLDDRALKQQVVKVVNSPKFDADTILQIVDAGDNLSHPVGRYIQQAFDSLQYNMGERYQDYPERVAEKLLSQLRNMPAYRVAEATTDMPFGSVSVDHPDVPVKPQQYHYGTEPSDKEIRKQRLLNVRERKQDLLRDYAQMGALRVEMIYGINNDVFLNKEQLLDYFDHLVDDPELTPLEYAHENGIPTDGLLKSMLRRAAQLGISALDVRKLFNSAKAKAKPGVAESTDQDRKSWMASIQQQHPDVKFIQAKMLGAPIMAMVNGKPIAQFDTKKGVAEGMFGSRPNPVLPIVAKIDRVARELTSQNVETGKQIIQSHTRDITRMLSPQDKAGVDVIEQGVAEGLPQILRKVVPGYAKREIDKKMDAEKFGRTDVDRDANYYRYKKIQDKLKEQGVAEAKDDYVPPKEADYGPEYQAMVRRVGEKAKQQEKDKQQPPKTPVRESRRALLRQIIQS